MLRSGSKNRVTTVAPELFVDRDADAARPVLRCGGDRNPPVTGTEIEDGVWRHHVSELEHRLDDVLGRRQEPHVGALMPLAVKRRRQREAHRKCCGDQRESRLHRHEVNMNSSRLT